MDANNSKEQQLFYVMAHTQRWTNIGFSVVFFFMGIFVYAFLNSDLPNWWMSLSDNRIVSFVYDVFLFIPVAALFFICIVAYSAINDVIGRMLLLVCFAFLMSVFLVFIVCTLLAPLWSLYSLGILFVYTIIVLFTLYVLDVILCSTISPNLGCIAMTIWKTILSLPIVFIIWKITGIGWMWLICLQVFLLYSFLGNKTCVTWDKINKLYIGGYAYKCHKGKVEMFKNYTYMKVGLYFTVYNYLDNILLVLNSAVDELDTVTDSAKESLDNETALSILAEFVDDNSINIATRYRTTTPTTFHGKKMIFVGLLFYALVSFCIYWFRPMI